MCKFAICTRVATAICWQCKMMMTSRSPNGGSSKALKSSTRTLRTVVRRPATRAALCLWPCSAQPVGSKRSVLHARQPARERKQWFRDHFDPQLAGASERAFISKGAFTGTAKRAHLNCDQRNPHPCDRDTYPSHGSQQPRMHSSCRVNDCRESRREVRSTRCRAAAPCHLYYGIKHRSRPSGRWPGRPSPLDY